MGDGSMQERALDGIATLRQIIAETKMPGDDKIIEALDAGESAIRQGHEVTYGTLGSLYLSIAGQKALRTKQT